MDACPLRLSRKNHMEQGSQGRKFWRVATPHQKDHQQVLPTDKTPKGHMNQQRKNVRSTKTLFEECNAVAALQGKKMKDIYVRTYDMRETSFNDQTGQFPKQSKRGHKYIMVLVEIDSNVIMVEPMKSRKDAKMIRAYDVLVKRLQTANIHTWKHVLDNKISKHMKRHIKEKYKIELEMIPPGCHQCNAAKVAIWNFKSHFLSVLAGMAESFPLHLWDRLLPQTELTLNLLRQSNATPTVSAYTHLFGPLDYNKMPLAPMGCEVQIHEKMDKCDTWLYHLVDGWYLATPPKHYRVHNCYVKTTQAERLTNTIQFKHKNVTNPTISPHDKIIQALANCKTALMGMMNDSANQQMEELQKIVNNAQAHLHQRQTTSTQPVLRVELQQVPRVDTNDPHQAPPRATETHTPSRTTKAQ